MNSSLRKADDDGKFYFFLEDGDEGSLLRIVDGPEPIFVSGDGEFLVAHQLPFLFGITPDQETSTALFEWMEHELLKLIEDALLAQNWKKCGHIIDLLTEADLFEKMKPRKRKVP